MTYTGIELRAARYVISYGVSSQPCAICRHWNYSNALRKLGVGVNPGFELRLS